MASNMQKPKFSVAITTPAYKKLINNTLKDPQRANNFIANVSTVVANNPQLQECEASTILSAAFLADSLNLSMSPQLGYCYLVPYETALKDKYGKTMWMLDENGNHILDNNGKWKKHTVKKAQFQMGYKGYVQLAQRTGQYKKIVVLPIKDGELIHFNPFEEEIDVQLIEDELEREQAKTIGYYAMFEYHTGYRKAIYWSIRKMMAHADKYSAAFSAEMYEKIQNGEVPEKDMWRYSSFWYKNFDDMAMKTMLRQLISKWGVVSIEMENVLKKDMAVIESETDYTYIDNDSDNDSDNQIPLSQPEPDMVQDSDNVEPLIQENLQQEMNGSETSEQEAIDIDSI